MSDPMVAIKGMKDGLLVTLDPSEDWSVMTADLAERIDKQSSFFAGARITVDVGERPVRKYELSSLKALLERRGLTLWTVVTDSDTTLDTATSLDIRTGVRSSPSVQEQQQAAEEAGTFGVLVRRTVRSGSIIQSPGHVIVYGDVNPGAEILAAGDIFVWGSLRGNVHAGSDGDEHSVICALNMIPTQLRIAGYIATAPPEQGTEPRPEVAFVRDEQIVVEAWR